MQQEQMGAHARLLELLRREGVTYRLINHEPEGRTDIVSPMRGHAVRDAAKCMVVMVKIGKKVTKFVLAVIPGDRRVDLSAIQSLFSGTFTRFAETSVAEELSGTVSGTILPFSFREDLQLIVDPDLFHSETIYFNAARLDCSLGLSSADYKRIANPMVARIAAPAT